MTEHDISAFLSDLEANHSKIKDNLETLYSLLEDDDEAFRVIELLSNEFNDKHEEIFINFLSHEEDTLRCQAADALRKSKSTDVLEKLKELSKNDDSYLVRGYSAQSVYDIYGNIYSSEKNAELIEFYAKLTQDESEGWVLAIIFTKLYLLGEVDCLDNLIQLLDDEDYHTRISVVLSFDEILDDNNNVIIKSVLTKALKERENQYASVREKILYVLDKIKATYP